MLVGGFLMMKQRKQDNWGDIILRGAEIKDGQLVCDTSSKWANSIEYDGPDITECDIGKLGKFR